MINVKFNVNEALEVYGYCSPTIREKIADAIEAAIQYGNNDSCTFVLNSLGHNTSFLLVVKAVKNHTRMCLIDAKRWCDVVRGCKIAQDHNGDTVYGGGTPNKINLPIAQAHLLADDLRALNCSCNIIYK